MFLASALGFAFGGGERLGGGGKFHGIGVAGGCCGDGNEVVDMVLAVGDQAFAAKRAGAIVAKKDDNRHKQDAE